LEVKAKKIQGKLILEDGSIFPGYSFGSKTPVNGEVVFNTGMVGYPESLTDPSYRGQILTLTYPLIGNYGVPGYEKEDGLYKFFESDRIQAQGLIITDYSDKYSHWNAKKSLSAWMQEYNVPGLWGVDTRALTKKLREEGTLLGKIVYDSDPDELPFEELATRWEYASTEDWNGIREDRRTDRSKHSLFGASKVAADVMVQGTAATSGCRR